MDNLAWYADLCRLPKGGFDMVGGGMYSGETGERGMGLAYTAPLRTLRITGGPVTKYSKRVVLFGLPWGNNRDLVFLATSTAKGSARRDSPLMKSIEWWAINTPSRPARVRPTENFCVRMLNHYQSVVRKSGGAVGRANRRRGRNCPALEDPDPRTAPRRATASISTGAGALRNRRFPPRMVSQKFLPGIEKILNAPDASWWELDGALLASQPRRAGGHRAEHQERPGLIDHEEWLLPGAALCVAALVEDPKLFQVEQSRLWENLKRNCTCSPAAPYFRRSKYQTNEHHPEANQTSLPA